MFAEQCSWNSIWAQGIQILGEEIHSGNETFTKDKIGLEQVSGESQFWVSLPSSIFTQLADRLASLINQHLWCPETSMYYDFDCSSSKRSRYTTCSTFWPLWAKIPDAERAKKLVVNALGHFEHSGGLVSTTEESRGQITPERPSRQWVHFYIGFTLGLSFWLGSSSNFSMARSSKLWVYSRGTKNCISMAFHDHQSILRV